ncbi:ktr3p, partial [Chrysochromulina tobinii]
MPSAAVKAFNAAVAHREAGDFSTSAQAYQSAIAMEPRMAEAYLNVAFVLSELRRFDEAEHAYRHALGVRKWPAQTAATASHNLGVLLDSLGRSSEATAAYKQALKYKPDFGPSLEILEDTTANAIEAGEPPTFVALINAGNEAFERGAHSDAERHYRLAVPLRDARREGAAYVGLGAALHGGGRLQEAKHVLMAGAKLNPSSPGMLSNLATVRSDLGEWKGAAGTWRRALALTPSDAGRYSSAAASLQRGTRPADAIPFLRSAAALDPTNWQRHYALAHACLKMAFLTGATVGAGAAATLDATPDAEYAAEAFEALRPLHRPPISLRMRAESGAEPPWTRYDGRGLVGDEPPPLDSAALGRAQSTRRAEAARAGRQKGVIVYKLGPKSSELDNLRLSLRLLTRYHNRKFRYPVLVAFDLEAVASLSESVRAEMRQLAQGAPLSFEQLDAHTLPSWLPARSVPEKVLGFPVAYRHMIRWKAGLMWRMASLEQYEYIWLLDTDAFLLGPLTYDVFGLMAARNASYGYADVHGEDPSIVGGLSECVSKYVRARPSLNVASTIFGRGFRTRQGKWDGTKFYTNFQVARRDFGNLAGYRDLFDFIDRDGGIYRHRWGADPILFQADCPPHQSECPPHQIDIEQVLKTVRARLKVMMQMRILKCKEPKRCSEGFGKPLDERIRGMSIPELSDLCDRGTVFDQ